MISIDIEKMDGHHRELAVLITAYDFSSFWFYLWERFRGKVNYLEKSASLRGDMVSICNIAFSFVYSHDCSSICIQISQCDSNGCRKNSFR